jgi:glycosyltransferase involved in cell wall biosynthesis
MNKISAVLIVRNEEKNIERCLKSIYWVDEIIVVDQSSTDKTVEIARKYTDKIYITENKLICEPDREFAISKAKNEWIIYIDADEVITQDLRKEIIKLVEENIFEVGLIPRETFFLGRPIKTCGWWPGYVPRLFKKGKVLFSEKIHFDGQIVSSKIYYLKNPLLHYSYNSLDDWIDKFKRYTAVMAYEYYQENMKINFKNTIREIILRPVYFFILKYFILKGFKDGWRGFFISFSSALTVIFSYFKLIEIYEKEKNNIS